MTASSGPLLHGSISSGPAKSRPSVLTRASNSNGSSITTTTITQNPTSSSSPSSSVPRSSTGPRSPMGGGIGGGLPSVGANSSTSGTKKRSSMFLTASDSFFSLGSRGVSLLRKPGHHQNASKSPERRQLHSQVEEDTPILDIRPMSMHGGGIGPPADREEAEREALREEAAKSVGLVERDPPPDVQDLISQRGSEDALRNRPSVLSSSASLLSSTETTSKWVSVTKPPQPPASTSSTMTSEPTLPAVTSSSQAPPSSSTHSVQVQNIPAYPASLASLAQFVQLSSIMTRHYTGGSFNFLGGKNKKWKPRLFVLTSHKPPPNPQHPDVDTDTQAHVHLFRLSSTSTTINEEQHIEIERLKIDEDSVVFVVDNDNAGSDVIGRKWVVKLGGLHGGGGSVTTYSSASSWVVGGTGGTGGMAAIGVMGSPSMMQSLAVVGRPQDLKVRWLVQCPDEETMRKWIAAVKAAVLVQRAERAGLGGSLHHGGGNNIGPSGDLDVLLSMRAQGLHQQLPSNIAQSSSTPSTPAAPPLSVSTSKLKLVVGGATDDASRSHGRPRTSPTTPNFGTSGSSSMGNALKGFFSPASASTPGSTTHQRSLSTSPPTTPLSTPSLSLPTSRISSIITSAGGGEELFASDHSSLGNRASALLNIQRASSYTANTSSSNNTPVTPSSATPLHGKSTSTHLHQLSQQTKTAAPHEEKWDQLIPDESTKAMWEQQVRDRAAAFDVDSSRPTVTPGSLQPPPRQRTPASPSHIQTHPLERSFQTELEGTRTSLDEGTGADGSSFIRPSMDGGSSVMGGGGGGGRVSFDSVFRSTPAVALELEPARSNVSVPFPPGATTTTTREGHTRFNSHGSDGSESLLAPQGGGQGQGGSSSASSSPKRYRKIPKMLAPPSGPLPSAPGGGNAGSVSPTSTTASPDQLTIVTGSSGGTIGDYETAAQDNNHRSSGGTTISFWNSKRISASSGAGLSIRSFASSSGGSRRQSNGGDVRLSGGHHPHPAQRPPPTFAPPPPPSPSQSLSSYGTAAESLSQSHQQNQQPNGGLSSSFNFRRGSRKSNPSPARSPDLDARTHRLSPPSAPPPSSPLPPRPDGSDAGRGRTTGHQRANSASVVNGSPLSTIPASPQHKVVDLPRNMESAKRTGAVPSGSRTDRHRESSSHAVTRHTSLRERLRMMSSPSPRSSLDMSSLNPAEITSAISSAGSRHHDQHQHHRPLDVIPASPVEDLPLRNHRPYYTSLPPRSPPIPPRSLARPKPISIASPSSSTDSQLPRKPLSPPPVRRNPSTPVSPEATLTFPVTTPDEIDGDDILMRGITS
ncbi:hypothetical protein FRB95_008695 [Tulasnella sp. JGI-2019a]|nr:hypothetical protein FRB95_008695 [Tulasnella sp. JGI-2019a]